MPGGDWDIILVSWLTLTAIVTVTRYIAFALTKFTPIRYKPSFLTDLAPQVFIFSVAGGYAVFSHLPSSPLLLVLAFVVAGMGVTLALLYSGLRREISSIRSGA